MLKDARGYRSPYINALNGAVAAARVVGGDVIPEETPSGTLLAISQTRRAGRFELFCGYDNGGESGADAFCLSDGALYVAAVAKELKPGRDVFRRDGDLMPRANGWCTRKTITEAQILTFACCRYKGEYFLIAKRDDEKASALLPETIGEISESEVEELFTFGQFYWAGKTGDKSIHIRQDIHGDVWYGGAATVAPAAEVLRPLTIRKFSVEETSSSGTTTVTKWGLYYPPNCIALLYQPTENTGLSLTEVWAEHADFPENAYLSGHANWLDITNYINEFTTNGFTYYALYIALSSGTNPSLTCYTTNPTNEADITVAETSYESGYIVPLAKVTVENGEISISQFNYGPLIEQWSIEGHALMACPDGANRRHRTSWSATEAGAELSAEYSYAYIGQAYTRLKVCQSNGEQFLTTARRHQSGWHDPASILYIRPLSLTNFGAAVS